MVPSLPAYEASSFGRVRAVPYILEMPNGGIKTVGGLEHFGLWRKDSKRYMIMYRGKNYKVANMVCEAFNGPRPSNLHVCMHLDEDSRNNRRENLSWGTQKENLNAPKFKAWAKSRVRTDIRKLGHMCATEIRIAVNYGATMVSVAAEYGVSACHVSNIMAGRVKGG